MTRPTLSLIEPEAFIQHCGNCQRFELELREPGCHASDSLTRARMRPGHLAQGLARYRPERYATLRDVKMEAKT